MNEKTVDLPQVTNTQSAPTYSNRDERTDIETYSAETGMFPSKLYIDTPSDFSFTDLDDQPSDENVEPDAALPATLPSYIQALEAGATPPREHGSPETETISDESDTSSVSVDGFPSMEKATTAFPSAVAIIPSETEADESDDDTAPNVPNGSISTATRHDTTRLNSYASTYTQSHPNYSRPLPQPPQSPLTTPSSVYEEWHPREKQLTTMFDLAVVSSYRPRSTEWSAIVASPGELVEEEEYDLGLPGYDGVGAIVGEV